ncbi:hypothetical protein M5G07_00930 [Serratia symbiotica]|nr:hypothetical protein [Serratia symbiotica]
MPGSYVGDQRFDISTFAYIVKIVFYCHATDSKCIAITIILDATERSINTLTKIIVYRPYIGYWCLRNILHKVYHTLLSTLHGSGHNYH